MVLAHLSLPQRSNRLPAILHKHYATVRGGYIDKDDDDDDCGRYEGDCVRACIQLYFTIKSNQMYFAENSSHLNETNGKSS